MSPHNRISQASPARSAGCTAGAPGHRSRRGALLLAAAISLAPGCAFLKHAGDGARTLFSADAWRRGTAEAAENYTHGPSRNKYSDRLAWRAAGYRKAPWKDRQ